MRISKKRKQEEKEKSIVKEPPNKQNGVGID